MSKSKTNNKTNNIPTITPEEQERQEYIRFALDSVSAKIYDSAKTKVTTITIENVPAENYELNIIDGNNFTIKNVKQYKKNPMTIICEDTISKKTESVQIWLGGNW